MSPRYIFPPLLEERGPGGEVNKDCIFCRIVSGELPSETIYRDDEVIAFRDIHPQAPTHVLIIPREHISAPADICAEHQSLIGRLVYVACELAKSEGISESGYRLIVCSGPDSGQEVPHLHFHLIGGHRLGKLV